MSDFNFFFTLFCPFLSRIRLNTWLVKFKPCSSFSHSSRVHKLPVLVCAWPEQPGLVGELRAHFIVHRALSTVAVFAVIQNHREAGGSGVQLVNNVMSECTLGHLCCSPSTVPLNLSPHSGPERMHLTDKRLTTEGDISSLTFWSKNAVCTILCCCHGAHCWVEKPYPGNFSQRI